MSETPVLYAPDDDEAMATNPTLDPLPAPDELPPGDPVPPPEPEIDQEAFSAEQRRLALEAITPAWVDQRRELQRVNSLLSIAKSEVKTVSERLAGTEREMEHVVSCHYIGCILCSELALNGPAARTNQEHTTVLVPYVEDAVEEVKEQVAEVAEQIVREFEENGSAVAEIDSVILPGDSHAARSDRIAQRLARKQQAETPVPI